MITEKTTPEECERLFRRDRNKRRQERRDANRAKECEREPESVNPVVELAEALSEILDALEVIAIEMPNVTRRLELAREKINKVRWPE